MTLDSQVSNRQIRWTSARGRNDRNAQPKTYAAQRRSISSVPDVLPRAAGRGFCGGGESEDQDAILMGVAGGNRAHHHATGVDQAKALHRAPPSKRQARP